MSHQSSINNDDDPFRAFAEELQNLQTKHPSVVSTDLTVDAIIETDESIIISECIALSDEEIVCEFLPVECSQEEEIETEEIDSPPLLPPSKEHVHSALDVLCLRSLFSQDGKEIRQKDKSKPR